jgi:hypothetical protein
MRMLLYSNSLLSIPLAAHLEVVGCHSTQLLHCWVRHLLAQAGSKGGLTNSCAHTSGLRRMQLPTVGS